ncbi:hypothetical protein BT96DRAFT_1036046 [Gymnopus androsaceus JB14]|uniref:Uncharacterized protein n=1 Tax=Gymnopus androsaceus JB14 TaxID=1447944 RepID=A0A6A4HK35_9AGAR|nr:hypothetical protein BT96DRAFT_1036046 [Gymnopus androsaceus JB14]
MTPLQFVGTVLAVCFAAWATLSKYPVLVRTAREWDINVPPSENATGHLIFQSVSSLLQHWPNARYRNGHTIVPGTVPLGTVLYHGRSDANYPKGPEWTATDPEHSFLFCKRPCWHITVVTTRPLKVLYFDGSSAVKMHGGSMDGQDMLLWGERKTDKVFSEEERLAQLCQWGKEFGLDGFVSEVMLCDFEAGVELVSFLQLANASPGDTKPPPTDGSEPLDPEAVDDSWSGQGPNPAVTIRNFELMHSSSQYNQYPGDTRIQLDLTRLVSFYDPDLAPSLVRARSALKGRWLYDLVQMESQDVDSLHRKLREALLDTTSSSVDWQTLIQVVIKRFGSRLEALRYVLGVSAGGDSSAFAQINIMLTPYIPYGVKPPVAAGDDSPATFAWASSVYKLCSTSHTSYIASAKGVSERMTASEKLLLGAVQDTSTEICRVLVKMWATGVEAGLDEKYWVRRTVDQEHGDRFGTLGKRWLGELDELMAWLDWHMWVKCSPACGDSEMCYMPTWPYFGGPPPGPAAGNLPQESVDGDKPETGNEWERPQPKCIRRIAPYSF